MIKKYTNGHREVAKLTFLLENYVQHENSQLQKKLHRWIILMTLSLIVLRSRCILPASLYIYSQNVRLKKKNLIRFGLNTVTSEAFEAEAMPRSVHKACDSV